MLRDASLAAYSHRLRTLMAAEIHARFFYGDTAWVSRSNTNDLFQWDYQRDRLGL